MTLAVVESAARRAVSPWTVAFAALLALAFAGFVALGVWQVQRLGWKRDLIARVESRIHAEPVAPPPRLRWASMTAGRDGYRRVRLTGTFLPIPAVHSQAVTALGGGSWVLAPLRTTDGDIVFVNRGFVPSGQIASSSPAGPVAIVGLIRMSEPGGGFLRRNLPAQGRWYSRDIAAMADARGLSRTAVAPYFVDAEAVPGAQGWPRGGLTVVRFRDSHLSYALTWFALALLTVVAAWRLLVSGRRLRQDVG